MKFRVWDKKKLAFWHTLEGATEHGIIITSQGNPGMVFDPWIKDDEHPEYKSVFICELEFLVIQFNTGLKDKNGVEIYEGDILKVNRAEEGLFDYVIVQSEKYDYPIHYKGFSLHDYYGAPEVIGHMFQEEAMKKVN